MLKRDSPMLSQVYPQSRSSSLSAPSHPHSENDSAIAAASNIAAAHRRRSSASQIIPIVSQALLAASANGTRRSPLAPLDPQFSSLATNNSGNGKDFASDMAHDDPYQSGRKSSYVVLCSLCRTRVGSSSYLWFAVLL